MKNLFKFQRNKNNYWQFGTNWLTDYLGGLGTLVLSILRLFWIEILLSILIIVLFFS